ncbi:sensor histidine kinase [Nonomuraea dietziae]|uniref:histidine kinase n=2 Tax=Nonomuraea dietziae TaxID=65515 RepID=A0A7W5VH81_9ACTN|nr:nitrate- and nitrite sensing domain-containing protein [Nonomuraea dietziae]MBB3727757.1 signal transduction histidine kinase [Nonomuraea dietziae]
MRTDNPRHAAPGEDTGKKPRSGSRFQLGNWRVRSRLILLILIPTVVGVLLAGIQLANSIGTAAEYRRLTQVAELVQRLGALSHELGKERALTAWYIADNRRVRRLAALRNQRDVVDAEKKKVLASTTAIDDAHSARVRHEVDDATRWLNGLDGLRDSIAGDSDSVPARAAIKTFTSMIDVMEGLQSELIASGNNDRLLGDATALGAIERAKEEVSRQQVILLVAQIERSLDYDDLSDFLGSWNAQQGELAIYDTEASADDLAFYRKTVRGQEIDRADAMRQRALAQMREYKQIRDLDITSRRDLQLWYDSTEQTVDAMRKVETQLAASIVAQTRVLSDAEQRDAIISGAVILVLLVLVLVITTGVAGSLVRPLRRLRAEALEVAGSRLPDTVRALRESGDGAVIPEVPSIGVLTRDEIGEVARAFDEVHREAVRLAGDEAKLRANVNAMFVNLSRRSQTLVERQLSLIEGLENGEEDEQRLSNLFKLDHLATRMRRNSENLLVLAGQEAARKWTEPVELVDIARASLSEVEGYERVNIQVPTGTMVAGPAVTDVVHLLAELIENSISFSPRETKVSVSSNRTEGGVMVAVVDLGIGMTADEVAQANWRLANPPVVDVSVSRRMGLFVVGRLALRHGIKVQLRSQPTGGVTALVVLPDTLLVSASAPAQTGFPYQQTQSSYSPFDSPVLAAPVAQFGMDTPDVRAFEEPMHTPWPGVLPPAEGESAWPPLDEERSFGTQGGNPSSNGGPAAGGVPSVNGFAGAPDSGFGDRFSDAGFSDSGFSDGGFPTDRGGSSTGAFPTDRGGSSTGAFPTDRGGSSTGFPTDRGGSSAGAFSDSGYSDSGFSDSGFTDSGWPSAAPSQAEPTFDPFARSLPEPEPRPMDAFGRPPEFETRQAPGQDLPRREPSDTSDFHAQDSTATFGRVGQEPQGGFMGLPEPDMTGPLPVVRTSPMDEDGEEFLPIFSSVGSDWFRRPDPEELKAAKDEAPAQPAARRQPQAEEQGEQAPRGQQQAQSMREARPQGLPQRRPGQSAPATPPSWSSPADSGFQAARAAAEPAQGGTTASGLPRRVPKANLVPGTASAAESVAPEPAAPISPDRVRSRLSSFQQGVRQGREFTRENKEEQ